MPWPSGVPQAFYTTDTIRRAVLGSKDLDDNQREWAYMQAGVALEQGEALRSNMAVDTITNIDTVSAAGSDLITDTGSDFIVNGVLTQMMISINSGTGEGQRGIILEVQSPTVLRIQWLSSSDGFLDTALDTTSDAIIYARWLAILSAVDIAVVGFAPVDVALNEFFWALRKGEGDGRMGATAIALSAGGSLTADATAGQLSPTATTDLSPPCATAVHDQATDGTLFPIEANADQGISAVAYNDYSGYAPTLT